MFENLRNCLHHFFTKNKMTYLGDYKGVDIYKEKRYALIFTDIHGQDDLKTWYSGADVKWAMEVVGPADRIEELK